MLAALLGLRVFEPLKMTSVRFSPPQLLCRAFAHDPAHSINDVGFAAAVRPHNRAAISGQGNRGGVYKRLKASKLDLFQSHGVRRTLRDNALA